MEGEEIPKEITPEVLDKFIHVFLCAEIENGMFYD